MRDAQLLERLTPVHTVEKIVGSMPSGDYIDHYQPTYEEPQALSEAIHEVQSTAPVTTPRDVDRLQIRLTALAKGEISEPITITGRCAEPVDIQAPIEELVDHGIRDITIVKSGLGQAIPLVRGMGQNGKPRSSKEEELPDGTRVSSYMGDAINGHDPADRKPDPTRMVAAAVQARDLAAGLREATGGHVSAAHEALLVPYEMSSLYIDPQSGRKYLLSADMPWIGKRTNSLDGIHVAMLEGIENPIGIKIGSDSTAEHIAGLQERLNPDDIPGKLTFMLRISREETEALETVVSAIAKYAPDANVLYDLHASTRSIDGRKIRAVSDIVQDAKIVSDALHDAGLKLHGTHLETVMDDDRLECVDTPDQQPIHPGNIDPQLNPSQVERVLESIAPYLLRPSPQEVQLRAMNRHPLPDEVYRLAGIDPTPPAGLTRTDAMRRVMAYRAAREAIEASWQTPNLATEVTR